MVRISFLLFACFNYKNHNAQVEIPPKKRMSIESIEVAPSLFWTQGPNMRLADMKKIAIDNDFDSYDLSGFTVYRSCCDFKNNSFHFGLNLRINKKGGASFFGSPLLRFAVGYNSGFYSSTTFENRETFTIDSVFVSFQGQTTAYAVDSTAIQYYGFSASSQRLRLNTSMIWRTDIEKRWSFSTGVGFGFGMGINSQVNKVITQTHQIYQPFGDLTNPNTSNSLIFSYENAIRNETIYETPRLTDLNIFLPFGVDFRIGNGSNLLRHVHLFSELSPSLLFTSFSGVTKFVHPGLMGTLGLRLHL